MQTRELRFDIGLLASRLGAATDWLAVQPETSALARGYFGASTSAAAALIAAAERSDLTAAVVSRAGRPDLAGDALPRVRAPTLLIVGERDPQVLDLDRHALEELTAEKQVEVVPQATHLFEEPGAPRAGRRARARLVHPLARWRQPVRRFRDRAEAGRLLAQKLESYRGDPNVLVLALPRGGVPVGFELARALGVQLDVFVVRKLGAPGQEELAIGAIASGGTRVIKERVGRAFGLDEDAIAHAAAAEQQELARREHAYRGDRGPIEVKGRTVILVDDGLATGATMRAAALALRARDPERLVVAVPVAAEQTCDEFRDDVDEVVCAVTPEPFLAVGFWYDDFSQTSDAEVRDLLERAGGEHEHAR